MSSGEAVFTRGLPFRTFDAAVAEDLRLDAPEIIRASHGASSSRKSYGRSFIPRLHDVCFVFKHRACPSPPRPAAPMPNPSRVATQLPCERKRASVVAHCLHQQHTRFRVYNVYVPKTSVADATVELRKRIRETRAIPTVSDAIDARRYGFALLAESIDQREALRDALAKTLVSEGISFTVVRAPGPWRRKK